MDKKLVETVKIDEGFINKVLTRLGLLAVGGFSVPAEGRIATNNESFFPPSHILRGMNINAIVIKFFCSSSELKL